jgi:hypothetical protein
VARRLAAAVAPSVGRTMSWSILAAVSWASRASMSSDVAKTGSA